MNAANSGGPSRDPRRAVSYISRIDDPSIGAWEKLLKMESRLDRHLAAGNTKLANRAHELLLALQRICDQTVPTTPSGVCHLLSDAAETIELVSHPDAWRIAHELHQGADRFRTLLRPLTSSFAELPALLLAAQGNLEESDKWPVKPKPPRHANKRKPPGLSITPAAEPFELDTAKLIAEDRRRLAAAKGFDRGAVAFRLIIRQMKEKEQAAKERCRTELAADPWRQYRAQLAAWRALRRVRKMWRLS